jgi:hypothetical protein
MTSSSLACKNPSRWVSCMPEVGPRGGRYRIYVRGRDHGPPHVHVANNEGGEAIIHIGFEWVELKRRKRMSEVDANGAVRLIAHRLDACLRVWKRFHP